ncbi:hypothetical protein [Sinorhizobium meliloti]|uniref:hypothetical protein n=1 Tax=Rhizobium meliloti TaxID=382 RepID=UPI000FDC93D1|nr:hypothetical protein [Sinorhizobium meliloti]RVM16094.1 hypothetical protein CN142_09550 [Sinorhizobium meliloti]RVP84316.1 hypothetical protein CN096_35970 [Sinorhizobium meliloti]
MERAVEDAGRKGGGCPVTTAGMTEDPIIGAIFDLRSAIDAYNANAPGEDRGAEIYAERTYRPPRRVIESWQEGARTRRGAVEALKLANDADRDGDYVLVGPMVRAALSYLESTI